MTDERTHALAQLNRVIDAALKANDLSTATRALGLKLSLPTTSSEAPKTKAESASVQETLDYITGSINKARLAPELLSRIEANRFIDSSSIQATFIANAADFSLSASEGTHAFSVDPSIGVVRAKGWIVGVDRACGPDHTVHTIEVPRADGEPALRIESSIKLADGTPLWRFTKDGCRFYFDVANVDQSAVADGSIA